MSSEPPNNPTEAKLVGWWNALHTAAEKEAACPRPPLLPVKPEEAPGVLHEYGLDVALTTEDDPVLWATVLRRHWTIREIRFETPRGRVSL